MRKVGNKIMGKDPAKKSIKIPHKIWRDLLLG
jgi:hypothetical protein